MRFDFLSAMYSPERMLQAFSVPTGDIEDISLNEINGKGRQGVGK